MIVKVRAFDVLQFPQLVRDHMTVGFTIALDLQCNAVLLHHFSTSEGLPERYRFPWHSSKMPFAFKRSLREKSPGKTHTATTGSRY